MAELSVSHSEMVLNHWKQALIFSKGSVHFGFCFSIHSSDYGTTVKVSPYSAIVSFRTKSTVKEHVVDRTATKLSLYLHFWQKVV